MTVLLLVIGVACLGFAVLGLLEEWLDPYGEHRDARNRNR